MEYSTKSLRLAMVQLNYKVGELAGNFQKMKRAVEAARDEGAELVVFSELALTGYPPLDLIHRRGFIDAQLDYLDQLAALTDDDFGILTGFVDPNPCPGKSLFNAAALCYGGEVRARVHKTLLP
ncbi:MAG: nitrilase-related carbon-nitrogen hydrolase, partial [Bradymonadaceae bacterium]